MAVRTSRPRTQKAGTVADDQRTDESIEASARAEDLQARAVKLVGSTWTDSEGDTWIVERIVDDQVPDPRLKVTNQTGIIRTLSVHQVEEILQGPADETLDWRPIVHEASGVCRRLSAVLVVPAGWVEVELDQAEEEYPPPEYDADEVLEVKAATAVDNQAGKPLDPELLNAGAEADDQYRMRNIDRSLPQPQILSLEEIRAGKVLTEIDRHLRALQASVIAERGAGTLAITIKVKPCADGELDVESKITPKPPAVKMVGKFYPNGELLDGLPKREPENQSTIFDARATTKPPSKPEPETPATPVEPTDAESADPSTEPAPLANEIPQTDAEIDAEAAEVIG